MSPARAALAVLFALVLTWDLDSRRVVLASGEPPAAPAGAAQFGEPFRAPRVELEPTGDPVTDALAGLRWREIGPANMGGRVTAIVGVPGDPTTFWVGGADGGVWKTTDSGITFEAQWQDAEAYSVGALALAPSDHNVVWLGSGEGDPRNSVSYGLGVWRSTNGGRDWTHLGLRDTERIKRIAVHPADPDVAWVCALGREWGPNEERGVFKTADGGRTWSKVLYVDQDTGCSDLDLDWSNPRNLYAGMWTFRRTPWHFEDGGKETALYVSRDGGDTWKKITATPDEPMARIGVSVAQSRPSVVYLITEYPTAGTLFRSEDYGETWTMVNDDRNLNFRPFYYADVFADPGNENVVWTLSGGQYKSTDGGRTFERTASGVHGDHQALWIDPANGDHVLSGSDGGYQVSFDGGLNYHIMRNVVLSQFYQIFFDDRDPYFVCGGLQDNGNWCGPSQTKARSILTDDWYTVSGGDGFYTVPVPTKPHLVYSNAQGGYFRITDTVTGRTRNIEPYPRMIGSQGQGMFRAKYRFNWNAPIHVSPHDPDVVYWGGNVLFRSGDEGYSWEVISPDLTTNDPEKLRDSGGEIYLDNTAAEFHCTIITIAESPTEAGQIWVGTDDGKVQVTRDDGATWTEVGSAIPDLPAETWIEKIDASRHVPGRAYIAVDNHRLNDFTPHAYRCDDYGRRCEDISAGLPGDDYVKVVREDPKNPDVLYVGMDRGIFVSLDAGRSYHDLRLNLPRVSVRDIKVHPRENDLIIGTHGRGAWILDDIAPIQGLADAMGEALVVFPIRRATRWERWDKDSNLGSSTWQGENPPDGAYVSYFLAEAPPTESGTNGGQQRDPTSGRERQPREEDRGASGVTVRITDSSGSLVRELTDRSARAGVNRVVWDTSHEGPRPAESRPRGGGGFFGSTPSGPPALPGTYTATVVANGREQSQTFELRGDPDVALSAADYQAQFDAAVKLNELMSTTNELIDSVFDLNEQLDQVEGRLRDTDIANLEQILEQTGTAAQQLEALDGKLQRPLPRMGYRQYPRLSEELATLNRNLLGAQARPTDGQLEVLAELDADTQERIGELNQIVDTTIAELNALLENVPKIVVDRPGSR